MASRWNRIIRSYFGPSGMLLVAFLWMAGLLAGCGNPVFPDRVELNRAWHFKYDAGAAGLEEHWYLPETRISDWVTVPGGSYWKDSYDGMGWFAQDIWLPEIRSDRSVALVVTSVTDSAAVWVNGNRLDMHHYGDDVMYADILPVYRPGKTNRFAIMVVDTGGPGGLTGDVYLRQYHSESDLGK